MTIQQAIEEFKPIAIKHKWHTQKGAFAECGDASSAFIRFLSKRGFVASSVSMIGRPDYVVEAREKSDYPLEGDDDVHVLVRIDGQSLLFDWTARQYDKRAAFPLITTQSEMEAVGWHFNVLEYIKARR